MSSESQLIGQRLLQAGFIKDEELTKALQIQTAIGGRLGGILVRIGAVSEENLLRELADQLQMPLLGLGEPLPDDIRVYETCLESPIQFDWFIDQEVIIWKLADSSTEEAITSTAVGKIGCLCKDPLDPFINEVLENQYMHSEIQFFLCRAHDIDRLVSYLSNERAAEKLFNGSESAMQLKSLAEEAPVIELVNNIISQAVDLRASDIHIEPLENEFNVRLRIDGVLRLQLSQPIARFPAVASRIKLISGIDIAERRLPQDGRLSIRVSGREMDVRVSTAPEVGGESIVMRLLPKEREDLSLSRLGMAPDHLEMMHEWSQESNGIVLVTGPTGSGKSTTLYAMLQAANTGDKKIITVEDPVEFKVKGVTQIQAHAEIGYTFASALRAILRQDPDTIMIGEIRDAETAKIAIQSALTGHLVLSTLHTNNAISAYTRLIDMGIEPFLVAAPLRAVQAQRLVRKLCSHCCEDDEAPADVKKEIEQWRPSSSWKKAKGCKRCHGTGYLGRIGIYEALKVTPDIQKLIGQNASADEVYKLARAQGFRNLREDGLLKASQGLTTVEEVLRVVNG